MSSQEPNTRTRILEATWALLDSNPGVAARMSDIARQAGVSRQALYLHFPNRTELFIATTKFQDEAFNVEERLRPSRSAQTGLERLDAWVEAWGSYIPKIYGVAKTLRVMAETDADASRAWHERMQDMREGCAAAVRALAADGTLVQDHDETGATDILWTMLSIDNWEALTRDCGWSQDRYLAHLRKLAIQVLTRV
ncbi:TetR/AcrR family transcriptional regulator [Roseovarius sp. E0-M6]|uniref:TetR/AcrR family transcriptional regulator n=1 Tax=Roseovarius sp. E0-M6 TaxID=3127118 RepID=UPI0030101982